MHTNLYFFLLVNVATCSSRSFTCKALNKDLMITRYNRICQLCMNMRAVLLPAASLFVLTAIESFVLGRWTKYIVPVIFLFHKFFKFVTLTWRNRVRDQNFFGKLRKMQNFASLAYDNCRDLTQVFKNI